MTVDDHPIYRDGLAALLAVHADLTLVAEAADGREAIARYRAHRPDVTLMDLSMPVMGGVEAIREIVAESPGARIVALTTYEGDADIHRALQAGARGYLLKDALRTEVAQAIRTVHREGWVLPEAVAKRLATLRPAPTSRSGRSKCSRSSPRGSPITRSGVCSSAAKPRPKCTSSTSSKSLERRIGPKPSSLR